MSWRFKASKYKNAAPIEPKKEKQILDLPIGSYSTAGNYIGASAAYVAFNWETQGSSLAVLPLDASGRQDRSAVRKIQGHADIVTDFAFSPFDDGLLATGSQDQTIKLWRLPAPSELASDLTEPELELAEQPRRVETVSWHPLADGLLTTSCSDSLSLWDCVSGGQVWQGAGHTDQVQSVAWQWEGKLLASQAKDKTLRVWDPRSGEAAMEAESHEGVKDSKVVWVAEDRILTSGFSHNRARELIIRDTRNLATPLHSRELDVSAGILVPLFDPDTKMVFLTGKGDRYIHFVEVTNNAPWIVEGLRYTGEQTKGGCLVPKRAMDVMKGEVARLLQLADHSIVPITWQVPRKSYDKFHADIFPDSPGPVASMGPTEWMGGDNEAPAPISLDPAKRSAEVTVFSASLSGKTFSHPSITVTDSQTEKIQPRKSLSVKKKEPVKLRESANDDVDGVVTVEMREVEEDSFLLPQIRPRSSIRESVKTPKFGRTTKFKHLKGNTIKAQKFENLKGLSKSTPAETDIVVANLSRVAVPLAGPGGKVAVFETARPGRIPDGVIPSLINGSSLMDMAWDNFNESRLYCALDDGSLNVWTIPEGGILTSVNDPDMKIPAHDDKVTIVKCHPLADGLLATVGQDHLVKIWQLTDTEYSEEMALTGHEDQVYSLAWSQCGRYIATACKDGKIRIYDPRKSSEPLKEGGNIIPKKGARIIWTNDNKFLLVTGFTKDSQRLINLYTSQDLKQVASTDLDVSPAILVPFYDEDSNTVFLSGKGETTLHSYEVAEDHPHLFPLSPHKSSSGGQGFAFLRNKSAMNVREIEFARAYRLTETVIECVSFTVPRVKSTHFQDDLFPPTRVLWRPAVSASDWLAGDSGSPAWVSLRPRDMTSVSSDHTPTTPRNSRNMEAVEASLSAMDKEKALTEAVSGMLDTSEVLEQDKVEGVDKEEWNE